MYDTIINNTKVPIIRQMNKYYGFIDKNRQTK